MIDWSPPRSRGQLPPGPQDDEARQRAAEQHRQRHRVRRASLTAVAAIIAVAPVLFAQFAIYQASEQPGDGL